MPENRQNDGYNNRLSDVQNNNSLRNDSENSQRNSVLVGADRPSDGLYSSPSRSSITDLSPAETIKSKINDGLKSVVDNNISSNKSNISNKQSGGNVSPMFNNRGLTLKQQVAKNGIQNAVNVINPVAGRKLKSKTGQRIMNALFKKESLFSNPLGLATIIPNYSDNLNKDEQQENIESKKDENRLENVTITISKRVKRILIPVGVACSLVVFGCCVIMAAAHAYNSVLGVDLSSQISMDQGNSEMTDANILKALEGNSGVSSTTNIAYQNYSVTQNVQTNSYWWPIGSDSTEVVDNIRFASDNPSKTLNDVVSKFGNRTSTIDGTTEMNYGIDISGDDGVTNVIAADDGIIDSIYNSCSVGDYNCNDGYGNMIIISHSSGDYTVYSNLDSIDSQISVGSSVKQGELIGKVGKTGATNDAILHFEIRSGGKDVSFAVNPLGSTYFSSDNNTSNNQSFYRPRGGIGSAQGYGARLTRFKGTSLTEAEFVSKVKKYCISHSDLSSELCNNASGVYQASKKYDVNPEFVITRAISEGCSPGGSSHNFWGIGCTNGGGIGACYSFKSYSEGIQSFAKIVTKSNTIAEAMSSYAYIGDNWYNPGSWSDGGCIYFPYVKEYMSASRASKVEKACAVGNYCSDRSCLATNDEDQTAYSYFQASKMGEYNDAVFGV